MRIASLIFLCLFATPLQAGFTVVNSSTDSVNIAFGQIENHALPMAALTPKDLQETLSRTAAKLASSYLEIINGTMSALSTEASILQFHKATAWSGIHYTLSAPRPSSFYNPDDLRLDIFFDINGVDMGGLGSVSGAPSGNGRQGIVRIDGMSGQQLAQHFEPAPHIELLSSNLPNYDNTESTFAQQIACLLFVVAAFLSSLRHRQHLDLQLELQRRRLRKRQLIAQPTVAKSTEAPAA